ncbi:hypothetical protein [Streptomyces globosus]|uniref:hypothetical protein n=1 Tax=Streptomyces globosus TaxID=68209 RepID=UPI00362752AD
MKTPQPLPVPTTSGAPGTAPPCGVRQYAPKMPIVKVPSPPWWKVNRWCSAVLQSNVWMTFPGAGRPPPCMSRHFPLGGFRAYV